MSTRQSSRPGRKPRRNSAKRSVLALSSDGDSISTNARRSSTIRSLSFSTASRRPGTLRRLQTYSNALTSELRLELLDVLPAHLATRLLYVVDHGDHAVGKRHGEAVARAG